MLAVMSFHREQVILTERHQQTGKKAARGMSCAIAMFDPDAYPELGAWAMLALEQQQQQREQQLGQERHRSEPPPRVVLEKRILNREEDAARQVDVGNCQHVEKRARM